MTRVCMWLALFAAVLLVLLAAASASAAVGADGDLKAEELEMRTIESSIWYQGFLADVDTGDPINGTVNIAAEMFDQPTAGSSVWGPETYNGVSVTEGWFHLELGDSEPLPEFDDPPYYLLLTVDGEEMDTRLKLASVPMAYHSEGLDLPFGEEYTHIANGFGVAATNPSNSLTAILAEHYGSGAALRGYHSGSGPAVRGDAMGSGLAGDFNGDVDISDDVDIGGGLYVHDDITADSDLDVVGNLETSSFRFVASPSDGYVLTSDASGWGSWEPQTGLTLPYHDTYSGPSDAFRVDHHGTMDYDAGEFRISNSASTGQAIYARTEGNGDMIQGYHGGSSGNAMNLYIGDGANSAAVIEAGTTGEGPALLADTDGPYGIEAYSSYASSDAHVVHAEYEGTDAHSAKAVYGLSAPQDYSGFGGYFIGGYDGVYGRVAPTGYQSYAAIEGYVWGGGGTNYGILGYAGGSSSTNWAGWFTGNVRVTGTIDNSLARSVIDHPLDPANKYLCHSLVQSPDMMSVHNGNVVLDAAGEAWVELPEWFQAVNADFRYQLTCIGGFAPVHVAEEISGNRFRIAGGEPGLKVSWQVTGIRQDTFAEENRIVVEEEKSERTRGRYLHPEAYGLPRTMSLTGEREELNRQMGENRRARPQRPEREELGPDAKSESD